jgi:hypothetical protein
MGNVATMVKLQSACEKAGIQFIDHDGEGGVGVRLRRKKAG